MKNQQKTIQKQILELKKQRLLKIIQDFITKKKQQERGAIVLPNPNNSYRNIYLCYRNWQKRYPNELLPLKSLWEDKDFQNQKSQITLKV